MARSGRRVHEAWPISAVARSTGLSADLIRAWEKRYAVVAPVRGPRGARLYSAADVDRLRLLGQLVRGGRRIGDVAELSARSLRTLGSEPPAAPVAGAAPYAAVLEALGRFDVDALDQELGQLLIGLGTRRFVTEVAAPLLVEVGDAWHAGRLAVADEHLLSDALHRLLVEVLRIRRRPGAPRVVLATPSGERHEFGLLLTAILAAESGLRPCSLGADVPAADVVSAARRADAVVVGLSSVGAGNRRRAVTEVRKVARGLPSSVELWIGGADAPAVHRALPPARARLLQDVDGTAAELERIARVHG